MRTQMNKRNLQLLLVVSATISLHAMQNSDLMRECNARIKDPRQIKSDGNRDIFGWSDWAHPDNMKTYLKMRSHVFTISGNLHDKVRSPQTK
jgi:hypothetical protein